MPVPVDPDSDSLASGAILYSYRWQCDQCLLAVVGPGLRFTVMSFLSFGVKETRGYAAGITSEQLSIDRTIERTMGDGRWARLAFFNILLIIGRRFAHNARSEVVAGPIREGVHYSFWSVFDNQEAESSRLKHLERIARYASDGHVQTGSVRWHGSCNMHSWDVSNLWVENQTFASQNSL